MSDRLKILFQIPSLETIYAGRTIYNGYKNAFTDMGHDFRPLTSNEDSGKVFDSYSPDIFITALDKYHLKFIDADNLNEHRKMGTKVFMWVPFWKTTVSRLRINESPGLEENNYYVDVIKNNTYADVYLSQVEQNDPRMIGFEETTGQKYATIPLACDNTICFPEYNDGFKADVSFVGTYLPEKRKFMTEHLFPLEKKYDLKLYGQDWTLKDRLSGWGQKFGQYYNINPLKKIQKPKLALEDERRIYSSSTICVNIHEDYQRKFGGDCNERTFKIPACGGFEIADDVACIRKYFKAGREIIIAESQDDWFDKIEYYIENPEKRVPIIEAGMKKVLKYHTYRNRVEQIIKIYGDVK